MRERTTREVQLDLKQRFGIPLPLELERPDVHRRAILGVEVKGLELVARAKERPHFETGYSFIFSNATANDVLQEFDTLRVVPRPSKGNIIFYLNDGQITHVGKLVDKTTVISKWGRGDVFIHPIGLVPESYGDRYALRASEENIEQIGAYTFLRNEIASGK
jgi:hypothetical protein